MALVQGSVTVSSVRPPFERLNVVPNEKVIYDKKNGYNEENNDFECIGNCLGK